MSSLGFDLSLRFVLFHNGTMILVVEDNEGIRENITAYLQASGHEVHEFAGVSGVVESLNFLEPELAILDVMLPDGNGLVLGRMLHERRPKLPFLFLTARDTESDRILGLEIGAEDYIVKPFSPRELVLRVQIILRRHVARSVTSGPARWTLGESSLEMDLSSHSVRVDGNDVVLTAAEWSLLGILCRQPGVVVPRERLLGEGLDYGHDGSDRTLNTHMKNLRAKLGTDAWIETIRGFGYKFRGSL